ncbi:hypothetical protein BCR44DRAFT_65439 [Catenaria anguillulae PL171]|uniref:Centrosomin N-terminal motif 1 domain-containing protein n=1 Tax=Catenaria anguillulae PL171 TaxID=765915 RepID=A0A1Y2I263_9FUNG|nr:hypothetical protein BCR44DRAFT_65439 [Catenaria anguillulae PL171]
MMFGHGPPRTPSKRHSGPHGPGGSPIDLLSEHIGDDHDTPNISALESPLAPRSAGNLLVGKGMTLKEQEQVIDSLRKENYQLRMKIYFLEDRLGNMAPQHMNEALKENVELRVQLHRSQSECAKLRDDLTSAQQNSPEAVAKLAERERTLRDQVSTLTQHAERLELQLHDTRQAKLAVEDELTRTKDEAGRTRAALQLSTSEVDTLRTELAFAHNQIEGLRSQLVDAGVDLRRRPGTASPSVAAANRRRESQFSEAAGSSRRGSGLGSGSDRHELQTQIGHLQAQIAAQNLILQARETDLAEANNKVSTLSLELDTLDRELEMMRAGTANVDQGMLERLARDPGHAEALRIQLAEMHRQVSAKATEANALRRELDAKNHAHEGAVAGLMDAWTKDQAALKQQVAELKRKLIKAEGQVAEAQAMVKAADQAKAVAEAMANRTERHAVQASAEQNEDLARAGAEVDRLTELVKSKSHEVTLLQTEIADRVRAEADLRDELASLRKRVGSHVSAAKVTTSAVVQFESELARVSAEMREAEAKWRAEVAARCAAEERELSRVAELDKKLRHANARAAELERHLKSTEEELCLLAKDRDTDAQAAQDSATRSAQADRHKDTLEYRRQLATLDKAATESRRHARKLAEELKSKDAELTKVRDQLTRWQGEAEAHHSKLTRMVTEAKEELARVKRGQAAAGGTASEVDVPAAVAAKYRALTKEHAEVVEQLRRTRAEVKQLAQGQQSSGGGAALFKTVTRVLAAIGSPTDSLSPSTPASILEDHVLHQVNQLMQVKSSFDARVRQLEDHWTSEFNLFMGKLDRKLAQMDRCESAIRTVTHQVRHMKDTVTRVTAHAQQAEQRRKVAEQELAMAQAELKQQQQQSARGSSVAPEVVDRVRKLEHVVRETEDRARMERHGAKQKVEQLYHTIRDLERQLEAARKMNVEYQDLLQHQRQKLELALNAPSDRRFERLKEELREIRKHETTLSSNAHGSSKSASTHAAESSIKSTVTSRQAEPDALMAEALDKLQLNGDLPPPNRACSRAAASAHGQHQSDTELQFAASLRHHSSLSSSHNPFTSRPPSRPQSTAIPSRHASATGAQFNGSAEIENWRRASLQSRPRGAP